MELFPAQAVMTAGNTCMIRSIKMASLVTGADFNTGVTSTALQTFDDYKEFKGQSKYCKKYVNINKYLKRNLKLRWFSSIPADWPVDREQTIVRMESDGFLNNAVVGTLKVTYYVKFKQLLT